MSKPLEEMEKEYAHLDKIVPKWGTPEQLIKQDERWQYTENATRLYEGYGIGMLNKFGLAAI